MTDPQHATRCEVLVAGAGIGGVCAALAAARGGAQTVLIEKMPQVGGTGVHSPVGLVCTYFDTAGRFINLGIHRELFPYLYLRDGWECQSYDEGDLAAAYRRLLAAEPNLQVRCGAGVARCTTLGQRLLAVTLDDGATLHAKVFIDATADGDLAACAGADYELGRPGDGLLQPATLTFRAGPVSMAAFGLTEWRTWKSVTSIWEQLKVYYDQLRHAGGTSNPNRAGVLAIPNRRGDSLLFNQTRIHQVDPTDPASVQRALAEGHKQVHELWNALRRHPALAAAQITHVSSKLGVREGRRVVGDYQLTEADCLGQARFDDMVAACGYALDIHNPRDGTTRLERIPGSGYYHIPYRCLIARGRANLLLGSRCISGTHEAHSSYRVMPSISAIGQAAGVAAALAVRLRCTDVRQVDPRWIRHALSQADQFVEGSVAAPAFTRRANDPRRRAAAPPARAPRPAPNAAC